MERPKLVFREKRRGSTDEGAEEGGKEKERGAGEGGGRERWKAMAHHIHAGMRLSTPSYRSGIAHQLLTHIKTSPSD